MGLDYTGTPEESCLERTLIRSSSPPRQSFIFICLNWLILVTQQATGCKLHHAAVAVALWPLIGKQEHLRQPQCRGAIQAQGRLLMLSLAGLTAAARRVGDWRNITPTALNHCHLLAAVPHSIRTGSGTAEHNNCCCCCCCADLDWFWSIEFPQPQVACQFQEVVFTYPLIQPIHNGGRTTNK